VATIGPGLIAALESLGPDAGVDLRNAPHVPSAYPSMETFAMRLIRPVFLTALLLATSAHAGPANTTHYLDLVNRAHDSVVLLEVAPAGSSAFQEHPLGSPLPGGGGSTTIEIADEGCLYDMRFKFGNGRTLIYKDVDVCNGGRLVIRPLPHRQAA
jgi:hypothetical protein